MLAFDVVSDIHSCWDEYCKLLAKLEYGVIYGTGQWFQPEGRRLILCGDLCDRGDHVVNTFKTVMNQVNQGIAVCVNSNHDNKLRRYLRDEKAGGPIKVRVGKSLSKTLEEINKEEAVNPGFKGSLYEFLCSLPHKFEEDGLIVCHAAYIPNKNLKKEAESAIVGETSGLKDKNGFNIRTYNWVDDYKGPSKTVVIGHDIVEKPELMTGKGGLRVWRIDTGCYKTGILTAIRFPEEEIIQNG